MMNNKTKNRYKETIHRQAIQCNYRCWKTIGKNKKKHTHTKKHILCKTMRWKEWILAGFVFVSSIICIQTYKLAQHIGEEVMTFEIDLIGGRYSLPNGKWTKRNKDATALGDRNEIKLGSYETKVYTVLYGLFLFIISTQEIFADQNANKILRILRKNKSNQTNTAL